MTIIFVGWPVIFVVLIFIFGVLTGPVFDAFTSPAALGLVRGITVVMGVFAVISGIGCIINCWMSQRTALIKMWNSILIAGISYCTWQAATLFIDFITEQYNQGKVSFLDGMLGGGFQFFIVTIAANMALIGLSDELGEKAYHSIFGTIIFAGLAGPVDERILERLIDILNMPVCILLLCVLFGSFVCTVVSTVKNGFATYDLDNIRKMWISIGIIVAFGLFMAFAPDQLMLTLLPILLLIAIIVVWIVKNR